MINNICISLHEFNNKEFDDSNTKEFNKKQQWLLKKIEHNNNYSSTEKMTKMVELLYEKGFSAINIMKALELTNKISNSKKYGLLIQL